MLRLPQLAKILELLFLGVFSHEVLFGARTD